MIKAEFSNSCHSELVSESQKQEMLNQVQHDKNKAFTLAEVLITLVIIGVIAAITIPNLMQSYKKHEVEVKVKEAYSILSNAIKMSEAENGPLTETLVSGLNQHNWAVQYLYPYLKGKNVYKSDDGTLKCPYYRNKSGAYEWHAFKTVAGREVNSGGYSPSGMDIFSLDNGMYLNTWWFGTYSEMMFIVDINGLKGPNQYGADIFAFSYYPPNNSNSYKSPGGKLNAGATIYGYEIWIGSCTAEDSFGCARQIQRNSWKFPNNYPIKKF